ncbi:MAG: AMP-binding protein [Chloroflexi bacterium]|nr:AMP-binding protein [Chloroflexota bacterium]
MHEVSVTDELTIPKLFIHKAHEYADKVALREKEFGIWRPTTWREYFERVRALALGFHALGLRRGDKVALIGDNRPEGLFCEMAALCVGAVVVWIYQEALLDEVEYIVNHADARFLIAEGQEEVDKGLQILPHAPQLEKIIWDDPKGMRHYTQPSLMPVNEVERRGNELQIAEPDLFNELVGQGQGSDIALLFYTSGTTSKPKGALLSHRNLLKMGQNLMRVDPYYSSDDFVSFLPFAWIGEQMMSLSCGLQAGFTINFPEEPETVMHDLRAIAPHTMFSSARLYEQMARSLQVKYADSTRLKRALYQWAVGLGGEIADKKFAHAKTPPLLRVQGWLADKLVLRALRDQLGLTRIRNAYTGGSFMSPDHFRFFHAIGVNLKQIYGQTEISGISVLHRSDDINPETVGLPLPETELQISPEGEILARSPAVFEGYYKDPEATRKTLHEGWLHSGDTGFLDDRGHLVFFDRSKDIMLLSDARKFSPVYIESRLKFSPYIKDVWIIGDQKPFVTAVLCIDYNVVGRWAESRGIAYTSYPELSQQAPVYELIEKDIRRVNQRLPESARVRRFVNLFKEFDADDAELTRTRKLRRAFLHDRYSAIVVALYADANSVQIDTVITYEGGQAAHIQTALRIQDVVR